MTRWKTVLVSFAAVPLLVGSAPLRVSYASKPEMIARSTVIAVVDVRGVAETRVRGTHWVYFQVAEATVARTLKGNVPRRIRIHAQEDFLCARVDFRPGRYLVFLRPDGELLAGSNWYLSARPVREGRVEWYENDEDAGTDPSRIRMRWTPLEEVLADIAARVPVPRRTT